MEGWLNASKDGVKPIWMQNRPTGVVLYDGENSIFVTRDQLGRIIGMIAREEKGREDDAGAA